MRRTPRARSKPLSRMPGSRRPPTKFLAERCGARIAAIALAGMIAACDGARAEEQLRPSTVVGDAIPHSLTRAKGDVERGRSIVATRHEGLCLRCRAGA